MPTFEINKKIMTRKQARALLSAQDNIGLWAARCEAFGEENDNVFAWAFIYGEATEGVEVEPGTVKLYLPDKTCYHISP
jgi:hypothetical protein